MKVSDDLKTNGKKLELSPEFKERFVRTLQGRDFILYGGLLELARQRGLKKIDTRIVQIPTSENNMFAVVEAMIETDDGVFKEIGDACPANVNRNIAPHILRMAATRAKARAMRDAVGIDMVALEELASVEDIGGDDPHQSTPAAQKPSAAAPAQRGLEVQCENPGCTHKMSNTLANASRKAFGVALCIQCQQARAAR